MSNKKNSLYKIKPKPASLQIFLHDWTKHEKNKQKKPLTWHIPGTRRQTLCRGPVCWGPQGPSNWESHRLFWKYKKDLTPQNHSSSVLFRRCVMQTRMLWLTHFFFSSCQTHSTARWQTSYWNCALGATSNCHLETGWVRYLVKESGGRTMCLVTCIRVLD